ARGRLRRCGGGGGEGRERGEQDESEHGTPRCGRRPKGRGTADGPGARAAGRPGGREPRSIGGARGCVAEPVCLSPARLDPRLLAERGDEVVASVRGRGVRADVDAAVAAHEAAVRLRTAVAEANRARNEHQKRG